MAHLVLVLTLLTWSFSFLAAVRLRQDLGLTEALAARFVPVLLGAGLLLLFAGRSGSRARLWPIVAMGLLSVPVYNVFFFHGMKTVPSGTGALIIALNPVFTAVLARIFLGEPFGRRRSRGLLLALAGVFVVIRFGTDKPVDWPYLSSALLLALAPLSWALYTVIGRRCRRGPTPSTPRTRSSSSGASRSSSSPAPPRRDLLAHPGALGSALYLAIPCTLLAWVVLGAEAASRGRGRGVHLPEPASREPLGLALRGGEARAPFLLGAASSSPGWRSSSCRCRSSAARVPGGLLVRNGAVPRTTG